MHFKIVPRCFNAKHQIVSLLSFYYPMMWENVLHAENAKILFVQVVGNQCMEQSLARKTDYKKILMKLKDDLTRL